MASPYRGTSPLPRHRRICTDLPWQVPAAARPYRRAIGEFVGTCHGKSLPRHAPTAAPSAICTDLPWQVPAAARPHRRTPPPPRHRQFVRTCHGKSLLRHVPTAAKSAICTDLPWQVPTAARPHRRAIGGFVRTCHRQFVGTCHGTSLPRHVPTAAPSADLYGLAMASPYRMSIPFNIPKTNSGSFCPDASTITWILNPLRAWAVAIFVAEL